MASTKQFRTAVRKKKIIKFNIDDEEFRFAPQKVAKAIIPVFDAQTSGDMTQFEAMKSQYQWLMDGLDEPSKQRIRERLDDEDDGLDFDTVSSIGEWLMEQVTGNPTG